LIVMVLIVLILAGEEAEKLKSQRTKNLKCLRTIDRWSYPRLDHPSGPRPSAGDPDRHENAVPNVGHPRWLER
jgi:hypothetical protein